MAFLETHGIAVVNNGGTPLVILPRCTHRPAPLKWKGGFSCDAHGCRFDMLGRVLEGPAKKSLKGVVPQQGEDGTLTVDLAKLHAGG
jgi:Rieske Fe-S protein